MAVPAPDSVALAAKAAEPPEAAVPFPDVTEATSFTAALVTVVVPTHKLTSCPERAVEAVCKISVSPVTAMEAIPEVPVCSVMAMEAIP
ncbi:hypothetical protein M9458_036737, partial [Cirrhinus mrigala]